MEVVSHGALMTIGFIAGLGAYFGSRFQYDLPFRVAGFLKSAGEASLVGSAIFLAICVFEPGRLVEYRHKDGKIHVPPDGVKCHMEKIHKWELGLASVALAGFSFASLKHETET